jgi:hypothetical protein
LQRAGGEVIGSNETVQEEPVNDHLGGREREKVQSDADALRSALRGGRCPICAALKAEEFDLLCQWVGRTDPEKQDARASLKFPAIFCNQHFWKLAEVNTPQGNAAVSRELLQSAADLLGDQEAFSRGISGALSRLRLACPLCGPLVRRDGELVQIICEWLQTAPDKELLLGSRGLCLPHTSRCYRNLQDPELKQALLVSLQRQIRQLIQELKMHLAKRTPALRPQRTPEEERAPLRGIEKLVGGRHLPVGVSELGDWSSLEWPG